MHGNRKEIPHGKIKDEKTTTLQRLHASQKNGLKVFIKSLLKTCLRLLRFPEKFPRPEGLNTDFDLVFDKYISSP